MAKEPEHIVELKRALSQRLADLRKAAKVTQQDVARHTFVDRTYVSHAERGQQLPTERSFWVAADEYLGANGCLRAAFDELVAAQDQVKQDELDALRARHQAPDRQDGYTLLSSVPLDFSLVPGHAVQIMEGFSAHDLASRRQVLEGLSILSSAALLQPIRQWVASQPVLPMGEGAIGAEKLDALQAAVRLFRRWDASGVGGLKRKAVVGQLNAVAESVRETTDSATLRTLLHIMAELAQLAGWMAYDHGLSGAAQRYYVLALHVCREAGPSALALGVKVIGDMTQLSTALGNYDDSLDLARTGLYALPRSGNALVRCELLGLESRAYVHLGNQEARDAVRSVEACVEAWQDWQDAADGEPTPGWLHYMNRAEVDCLAANTYTQLALQADDQPRWQAYAERAEHHTLRARRTRANGYDRSRILDEIRLARVRLSQREPTESVAVATNALRLADAVRSSVVCDWLIRLHADLTARHATEQLVSGFSGGLRDYLRRAAPAREREVNAAVKR